MEEEKEYKYTFEDWKKGIIYKDFYDFKMPKDIYNQIKDVGHLSSFLYSEGLISYETHQEIEEAQKKVFYKFSDHNAESHFIVFKSQYEKSPYPDKFLKQKIKNIENDLDAYPDRIKSRFYEGEWSNTGIYYQNYIILQDERFFDTSGSGVSWHGISPNPTYLDKDNQPFTIKTGQRFRNTPNLLFDFRVLFLLLEKLKSLDSTNTFQFESLEKKEVTKKVILVEAHKLKDEGYTNQKVFEIIENWLFNKLKFTNEELNSSFGFTITSSDSFAKLLSRNPLHSLK